MVSEIQKVRKWKMPGKWQEWVWFFSAIMMTIAVFLQSLRQAGPGLTILSASLFFLTAINISNRRLHKELVQEIDALRQELDQLKKNP